MPFELKRRPKSLSYSSLTLYEKQPEEFFLRYLAGSRAPRLPQESYMSIGSGFDARVKADLHSVLFGLGSDPKFEFDAIFVEQVEEHNRDWCLAASQYVYECYVHSGMYASLLALLQKSSEPPKFESKVEGIIGGVPFNGKPDCRFVLQFPDFNPVRVVLDWKVKGFCSKHGASPSKGYALCTDGYDALRLGLNKTKAAPNGKPSASHNTSHKLYLEYNHRGFPINQAFMETCNDEYADQVSIYGWLLGEEPGDENVVTMIDELVSKPVDGSYPLLRVATHKARVSKDYQLKLLARAQTCWAAVESGYLFPEMTRQENDDRCELLEDTSVGLQTDGTESENWFNECVRPQFKR